MGSFERWQVALGITQTCISLALFLGAIYVGFKQNEINQNLLDLKFRPAIEITYSDGKYNVFNKSETNLMFWGTRLNEGEKVIEKEPVVITPGGFYYLRADKVKVELELGAEFKAPFEMYFETEQGKRFIGKARLIFRRTKSGIETDTQTTGITPGDWSK